MMTFGKLIKNCTTAEIEALAWHLAMFRARKTYEALRKIRAAAIREGRT